MKKILVIGAGFGGLSAAAELSRRGFEVKVLEAHVYPGGSAGTFYHQGYRFDAGATLAGGFAAGAVMDQIGSHFGLDWQASPAEIAMIVHQEDGSQVTRWTDSELWEAERLKHFGKQAEPFWQWQENTADALWDFALKLPAWPPQTLSDFDSLTKTGYGWIREIFTRGEAEKLLSLVRNAFRPLSAQIPPKSDKLRQFADAQLLISAQTTSSHANALYGSVALDLARQGVVHIPGGMGGMANKMVDIIHKNGGKVLTGQEVRQVSRNEFGRMVVKTKKKEVYEVDLVIFNLPPWNIAQLLTDPLPSRLSRLPSEPQSGWGAFMLYVGLDASQINNELPLHHQVIVSEPLGEGNSIFMSLSPAWDHSRAPEGKRALTISTHTDLKPWWHLFRNDRSAYEVRKDEYTERVLSAAERVLPGIKNSAELVLPGTPVTFQRFTRRHLGWVGGFPQTSLLRVWGPRLSPQMWMVGDTVFPGQSVPAVMLAGLRVARAVEAGEGVQVHDYGARRNSGSGQLLNMG